jgi:membrane protein implicated in regulation of membrane protease activity
MDGATLLSLGAWTWFLAAGVLMILELAVPGAFMLWLALAAAATGLLGLFIDLSWQREILLFAVLSLAFVLIGRNLMRRLATEGQGGLFLNRRAEAFVGRQFTLSEPIVGGAGRVRIDDTVWRIVGADAPAGTRIKVAHVEGAALVVEPIEVADRVSPQGPPGASPPPQ